MIRITLQDLSQSVQTLSKEDIYSISLEGKTSFKIARILKELNNEYSTFQKSRQNLILKYGEKNENGSIKIDDEGNFKILRDNVEQFTKELEDLLATEIELNADYIDLNEIENANFTIGQMIALNNFIK